MDIGETIKYRITDCNLYCYFPELQPHVNHSILPVICGM